MTQNNAFVLGLAMFSFMMTVIWGTPLLRVLRHFKVGKIIRVEEPDRHRVKMGTPTMGGILFIIPVVLLTGLLNAASFIGFEALGSSVLVPLIVMVSYGALGALDDWEGIRGKRRGEGMTARAKFLGQVVLALGTAYVLKQYLDVEEMILPGIQGEFELGWWYIPVAAFIIVSESNAVNFTDGLDGTELIVARFQDIRFVVLARDWKDTRLRLKGQARFRHRTLLISFLCFPMHT